MIAVVDILFSVGDSISKFLGHLFYYTLLAYNEDFDPAETINSVEYPN
jgi:hypothetical protein